MIPVLVLQLLRPDPARQRGRASHGHTGSCCRYAARDQDRDYVLCPTVEAMGGLREAHSLGDVVEVGWGKWCRASFLQPANLDLYPYQI